MGVRSEKSSVNRCGLLGHGGGLRRGEIAVFVTVLHIRGSCTGGGSQRSRRRSRQKGRRLNAPHRHTPETDLHLRAREAHRAPKVGKIVRKPFRGRENK